MNREMDQFRIDKVNQCVWQGNNQIDLSPKAFSVLLYLAERAGQLVTKQELLDGVWPDVHVTEGVLKRAVLEIRKALNDPADEPRVIQTLHRRGYRFTLPPAEAAPGPAQTATAPAGFIGRTRELRQLDALFERTLAASRQVVFLTGEAGLGKSALIEQWLTGLNQTQQSGQTTVPAVGVGRCLRQFGMGEPYLAVFEAIQQMSGQCGNRFLEVFRNFAPTWLLNMPALLSPEDRVKLRGEAGNSSLERMLREIAVALEVLSAETPLVLILEDLQWADPSTVDLVSAIARRTSPARLLLVATYRPEDAARRASLLLDVRNELELHRQCKVMALTRLSEQETGACLAARMGTADSPAALTAAIYRRTNGNPLYVAALSDEWVRLGALDPDPAAAAMMIPESLQRMFERQAAQLTESEQAILHAAAVAGESFSIAEIAAALGWDESRTEDVCDSMARQHMILKKGPALHASDRYYGFQHVLCREALYRMMPSGLRTRLHSNMSQAHVNGYSIGQCPAGILAGRMEHTGHHAAGPQAIQ